MAPPPLTEIKRALGVTQPVAVKIRQRGWCPDCANRDAAYWVGVAKMATAGGLRSGGLAKVLAAEARKTRPREPTPKAPPEPAELADDTLDEIGYKILKDGARATGVAMVRAAQAGNFAQSGILADKFVRLQQEMRQTAKQLHDQRKELGELMHRDDVLAASVDLWFAMRSALDLLCGQLTGPAALGTWVAEVGGTMPETAEARAALRSRVTAFVEDRANALADSLLSALRPPSLDACTDRYVRERMAAHLRRLLEKVEA